MFYDIGERRVTKALHISRKYLTWVQNSVFEGEISVANLRRLKSELNEIIDQDSDSIIIYVLNSTKYTERQILGIEKNSRSNII